LLHESPKGRRSLARLRSSSISQRTQAKNNAIDLAAAMGVEILNEEEYRELQN
jgi:hypothetical protein